MSLFTIIVQGPLNSTSITNIHNYLNYGSIVISTMEDIQFKPRSPYIKFISCKTKKHGYNRQNIWKQCITTLEGLKHCSTKYAIKVRSDESYEDLYPLIMKVLHNPNKIITSDFFFKKDKESKYHPSDHVIAGRTKDLLGTYQTLKSILLKHKNKSIIYPKDLLGNVILNNEYEHLVAEQLFCVSFLKYKKEKIRADNSTFLMNKYFAMIKSKDLGRHKITCNSCAKGL